MVALACERRPFSFPVRRTITALSSFTVHARRAGVNSCRRIAPNPAHRTAREPHASRRAPMSWMQRLKRVFHIDIEHCGVCGGTSTATCLFSRRHRTRHRAASGGGAHLPRERQRGDSPSRDSSGCGRSWRRADGGEAGSWGAVDGGGESLLLPVRYCRSQTPVDSTSATIVFLRGCSPPRSRGRVARGARRVGREAGPTAFTAHPPD